MKMHQLSILGLCLLFSCTLGHLCLLSPVQRGSISGLNMAGSNDCLLTKGPCGGRNMTNVVSVKGGSNMTIIFQKNLDHWAKASPGYFSVRLGTSGMKLNSFEEMVKVPDAGEPSLHLYTVQIKLPKATSKAYNVLQVVYETNNPSAPPSFYQCADLWLY